MNTDHTLEEVGQQFSLLEKGSGRLEAVFEKLKHPSRSRQLKSRITKLIYLFCYISVKLNIPGL